MPLDESAVIKQIDDVLHDWRELRRRSQYDDLSDLGENDVIRLVTRAQAAVERLAPSSSSYLAAAQSFIGFAKGGNPGWGAARLVGILEALRTDYQAGYLRSITELIHADVFADFLEMARYLHEQGYKDPSAVVVGSVLEEHLRKMCIKNGLAVENGTAPKKADAMNADLAAASIFSKLDQKSVTAWLDLRNKAAHGKYAEYTGEQVALMLQGVRDFIGRHGA